MLSAKLDTLLLHLRAPSAVRPIPTSAERQHWQTVSDECAKDARNRSVRAMEEGIPFLYYGDAANLYPDGTSAYGHAQRMRRELLKALVMHALIGGANAAVTARIADLMFAICEEAAWTTPSAIAKASFLVEPVVDEISAETAGLLAACCYLLTGSEYAPLEPVKAYAMASVMHNVLSPFLARDDWPFLRTDIAAAPGIVEDLLTASLLIDTDDRRRWLCVKKAVRGLDNYFSFSPKDGGYFDDIEGHVTRTASVDASLRLISIATGGEVEARGEPLYRDMVKLPGRLHIYGKWFVNSGSMLPDIDGEELFATGHSAGDDHIMQLASRLYAYSARRPLDAFFVKTPPLLRQARSALIHRELAATKSPPPELTSVYLPDTQIIIKRFGRFCAALRGGEFLLFADGEPVLIHAPCAEGIDGRNLLTIDGIPPKRDPVRVSDIEQTDDGPYSMMTMNIAATYAERADLQSYQRTVVMSDFDQGIRLIDMFRFGRREHSVHFHFMAPEKPIISGNGADIGSVHMEWEEGLFAHVAPVQVHDPALSCMLDSAAYQLTLKGIDDVRSGNFTFVFTSKRGGLR